MSLAQDKPYQTNAQENGLAAAFNLNTSLIKPAKISDMQWKAKRPKDASLNVNKATALLNKKPLTLNQAFEVMKKEKNLYSQR
jgi:dTDP-4-dehydrorhamnose reductase